MGLYRDVGLEIAKNGAMSIPWIRRRRLHGHRAGEKFLGTREQLDRYAFQVLNLITEQGEEVTGKRVLEIGPGDSLSSGISLLAAGIRSYTCLDRFVGDYSGPDSKLWYRSIKDTWLSAFPDRPWPDWLDPEAFPEGYPEKVVAVGTPIEAAKGLGQFDIVCSFQVAQSVSDITAFAQNTAAALSPDGVAIHRVDFGPVGVWQEYDDPLTFLRFSEPVWHAMGSARGMPNRARIHQLREAFTNAGLTVEVSGVLLMPTEGIARISRRFREMPAESVRTRDAVFVCRHRKPLV